MRMATGSTRSIAAVFRAASSCRSLFLAAFPANNTQNIAGTSARRSLIPASLA